MRNLTLALIFLHALKLFAADTRQPSEYYAQVADLIVIGEIEKMEYDIPSEPPHEDFFYNIGKLRVDEVLKGEIELDEEGYYNLKLPSKKNGVISAISYWDIGAEGIWFLKVTEDGIREFGLSHIREKERVKRELSYNYKRQLGSTMRWSYHIYEERRYHDTPTRKLKKMALYELVFRQNLQFSVSKCPAALALDGDINPLIEVQDVDPHRSVIAVLRDICDQHENLDFEFGDHQFVFFDRTKAEDGAINSEDAASPR